MFDDDQMNLKYFYRVFACIDVSIPTTTSFRLCIAATGHGRIAFCSKKLDLQNYPSIILCISYLKVITERAILVKRNMDYLQSIFQLFHYFKPLKLLDIILTFTKMQFFFKLPRPSLTHCWDVNLNDQKTSHFY